MDRELCGAVFADGKVCVKMKGHKGFFRQDGRRGGPGHRDRAQQDARREYRRGWELTAGGIISAVRSEAKRRGNRVR